jgi:3-methyladenine DNA glycosylase AlkD
MRFEEEYRRRLFAFRDETYHEFASRIVPGSKLIGIRIPVLRKLTSEFLKDDPGRYLQVKSVYNEEKLIKAFIIAGIDDFQKVLGLLEVFLPEIDNWAVCDSAAAALKIFRKHRKEGLAFISSCLEAENPFRIRFALVLLLAHYLVPDYLGFVREAISALKSDDYYVRMAAAWLIQALYVKAPELALSLLDGRLDEFTHNRAIQKILESRLVGKEEKEALRGLKI